MPCLYIRRWCRTRSCGIGYWNIGTRGDVLSGGDMTATVKIGSYNMPMILVWSKRAVGRVRVSPTYRDICWGIPNCEMVNART